MFCEAPGSLTFEMQDIPAIAQAAHARGIPVLADNTWGTPYFFRSFERGVDVSIHAATKYIAGHSDVMMGVDRHQRAATGCTVRKTVADYGYGVSPDDCYLALRGFRTIGVRMKQQMANALKVARWLAEALGREARDVSGAGERPGPPDLEARFRRRGLAFLLRADPASSEQAITAFVDALEALRHRLELGRLREPDPGRAYPERSAPRRRWDPGGPTIRVHIGLEDPDDLIADLEAGVRCHEKGVMRDGDRVMESRRSAVSSTHH